VYIYQIEISNICSLQCSYCPHPTQVRKKGYMQLETFQKCVALYKRCENVNPLFLHNFGEPLLHPQIATFISYARDHGVRCSFFTNGLTTKGAPFNRDVWLKLADAGLEVVDFSAHKLPFTAFQAIVDGVVRINNVWDPQLSRIGSWAGQTGPSELPIPEPCIFERDKAMVILWDGRVSACCLDVEGQRQGLHIDHLLAGTEFRFERIPLCGSCASMRDREVL
jgi:hypothetical protein